MKQSQPFSQYIRAALLSGSTDLIATTHHLFSLGYRLDKAGAQDSANEIYRSVIDAIDELRSATDTRVSDVAIAECALKHGISLCQLGRFLEARAAFRYAVDTLEQLLMCDTTSSVIEKLAHALRLLAFTKIKCGNIRAARRNFRRSIALYRNLIAVSTSMKHSHFLERFLKQAVWGYQQSAQHSMGESAE